MKFDLSRLYDQGLKLKNEKEKKIRKMKDDEEWRKMEECVFKPKLFGKFREKVNGNLTER